MGGNLSRTFEHEGWKVLRTQSSVRVQAPNEEFCVDPCDEGLYLVGSRWGGNPFQPAEAVSMTIPWPVLEAIFEAWREVSSSSS